MNPWTIVGWIVVVSFALPIGIVVIATAYAGLRRLFRRKPKQPAQRPNLRVVN